MRGFRKITIEEWTEHQRKVEDRPFVKQSNKNKDRVIMTECRCGALYWSDEKEAHLSSQVHDVYTSQAVAADIEDHPREVDNPLDYGLPHPRPTMLKKKESK